MPKLLCGVALTVGAWATAANAAPAPVRAPADVIRPESIELASHAATYTMVLVRAQQQDGVRGASGRLAYRLIDHCTGYTIESELTAKFSFSNGSASDLRQTFAGWESKDGRHATFRMQMLENGELTDNYSGVVDLAADGSGTARYDGAQPASFTLPAGSMLSSWQMKALLADAKNGSSFFLQTVMDGSFADGPHSVSGVIAPAIAERGHHVAAADNADAHDQSAARIWPITMAYFPLNTPSETPSYEMSVDVRSNGIMTRMTQDFGSYTLGFEPQSIVELERDPC